MINGFGIGLLDAVDQTIKMADIRQLLAKEQISSVALDQNGREIVDIVIVQQVGVVFNINPDKRVLRPCRTQFAEFGLIIAARITPGGTIAGYKQAVVLFKLMLQCRFVSGIK